MSRLNIISFFGFQIVHVRMVHVPVAKYPLTSKKQPPIFRPIESDVKLHKVEHPLVPEDLRN
jgi:hypothetical protein